ncbi:hypothetical protein DH2020_036654 [Rehmannia glutinosa]|uniref:F-box associated beta-propeller type 1 domain-containing protein n=1 Tax=Rehmannia glutinosa TaxID=99300 RepID=A0ABR0V334_REHGL
MSETVLICQKLTPLEPDMSYFHVLDLDHGKSSFIESSLVESFDIRASCDGLVLATTEKNLILMNPVTRKNIMLPLGAWGNFGDESFGVAFCNEAKTYKVARLFRERSDWQDLYVYDFDKDEMKMVYAGNDDDAWDESIDKLYIPHQNTLVSWDRGSYFLTSPEKMSQLVQPDLSRKNRTTLYVFASLQNATPNVSTPKLPPAP